MRCGLATKLSSSGWYTAFGSSSSGVYTDMSVVACHAQKGKSLCHEGAQEAGRHQRRMSDIALLEGG